MSGCVFRAIQDQVGQGRSTTHASQTVMIMNFGLRLLTKWIPLLDLCKTVPHLAWTLHQMTSGCSLVSGPLPCPCVFTFLYSNVNILCRNCSALLTVSCLIRFQPRHGRSGFPRYDSVGWETWQSPSNCYATCRIIYSVEDKTIFGGIDLVQLLEIHFCPVISSSSCFWFVSTDF